MNVQGSQDTSVFSKTIAARRMPQTRAPTANPPVNLTPSFIPNSTYSYPVPNLISTLNICRTKRSCLTPPPRVHMSHVDTPAPVGGVSAAISAGLQAPPGAAPRRGADPRGGGPAGGGDPHRGQRPRAVGGAAGTDRDEGAAVPSPPPPHAGPECQAPAPECLHKAEARRSRSPSIPKPPAEVSFRGRDEILLVMDAILHMKQSPSVLCFFGGGCVLYVKKIRSFSTNVLVYFRIDKPIDLTKLSFICTVPDQEFS